MLVRVRTFRRVVDLMIVILGITVAIQVSRLHGRAARNGRLELVRPGTHLDWPSIDWQKADISAVVVASTSCPACEASLSFYKDLALLARTKPGIQFIVAGVEPSNVVHQWLLSNDIETTAIQLPSNMDGAFLATPTLLLVNRAGIVNDIMLRRLKPNEERLVFARLTGHTPEPLQNILLPADIDARTLDALTRESATTTVLDPRNRTQFNEHHWLGAINIPDDELSTRGRIELRRNVPLVIDCSRTTHSQCIGAVNALIDLDFRNMAIYQK